MSDRLKQIVLAGNRLAGIEERKLSARGVTDLEGALVEVARPRPETVGAGSVAGSVDPVTPHALGKVDALARFDHLGGRFRGQVARLKPLGHVFGSDQRNANTPRCQDDSEGGCGNHTSLLF